MAEYLVLIYHSESERAAMDASQREASTQSHRDFMAKHAASLRSGKALQPTATATSLRPDGAGGVSVTDGAFAETKEALGGYYVVEAPDLDAALAIARDVPAPHGGVEVRPIWDVS